MAIAVHLRLLSRPILLHKRTAPITSYIRTMTSSPEKIDWLIIIPDIEGALEKRMAVRPDHLNALKPAVESGFWKLGGAMLEEPPQEGEPLKIKGSAMMAHAATKEEVIEQLKGDIYFKNKVWDFERVQIYPFKTAFRRP